MTTPRKSSEAENPASGLAERGNWPALGETASFCLLIATLAWAPFPLGSNRPWSWTLMTLLIVAAWLCWLGSVWERPARAARSLRRVAVPLAMASLALLWGVAQCLSWMPGSWLHPVWRVAADGLGESLPAMVSLNGWSTITELMKLATYMMAGWLAYVFCQRLDRAKRLLDALIIIGTGYATYALVMAMLGIRQVQVFYSVSPDGSAIAAPFVTHASFGAFVGMITLCAGIRLFALGSENIVSIRGPRPLFLSTLKFVFGGGTPLLISAIMLFSMLVASASKAAFLATLIGVIVLLIFSSVIGTGRSRKKAITAVAIVGIFALALFQLNGDPLQSGFNNLIEGGEKLGLRTILWSAASFMIGDSHWTGLGLGSFHHAYPLYADHVYPYNMDKAHNDYMELAAGWGLPAALLWWGALAWLCVQCMRGVLLRRRNRTYPLIAIAATALIAFHSVFDFTLQIPAVALTYAAILGLGMAQSFSTRR